MEAHAFYTLFGFLHGGSCLSLLESISVHSSHKAQAIKCMKENAFLDTPANLENPNNHASMILISFLNAILFSFYFQAISIFFAAGSTFFAKTRPSTPLSKVAFTSFGSQFLGSLMLLSIFP